MTQGRELGNAARTLKINTPEFWAEAERIAREAPGFTISFKSQAAADTAYGILRELTRSGSGWQPGDPAALKAAMEQAVIAVIRH